MKIAQILKIKGHEVMTIRPSETVAEFAALLKQKNIGAMVVSNGGLSIDGIISERDIACGVASHGRELQDLKVSDLMSKLVITCSSDDNIADVAKTMTNRRIRHLPVKDGEKLVGIISVGDVVKYRLEEVELEANVLRDYAIAIH